MKLAYVTRNNAKNNRGSSHNSLSSPSSEFTIIVLQFSSQNCTRLHFKFLSPVTGCFWVPFIESPNKSVCFLSSFLGGGDGVDCSTCYERIFSELPSTIS